MKIIKLGHRIYCRRWFKWYIWQEPYEFLEIDFINLTEKKDEV